jgi:hypothetical protein
MQKKVNPQAVGRIAKASVFNPWDYEFGPYKYDTGSPWTDYDPLKNN